jgi:putative Holliday junction resolvase
MIILSVDYGDARTGLAVCDGGERLASPAGVIAERSRERLAAQIAEKAAQLGAGEIVLGHPINMNGTLGPRSEMVRAFAALLKTAAGLPVVLWDERRTTVSAIGILNETDVRGKKRKAVVDAVAAVLILENYLAYRRREQK